MLGELFQLLDSENEQIGLIHYLQLQGKSVVNEVDMVLHWQNFKNSPDNDSDSVDDFVEYLNDTFCDKTTNYFSRVYVKEIFVE